MIYLNTEYVEKLLGIVYSSGNGYVLNATSLQFAYSYTLLQGPYILCLARCDHAANKLKLTEVL